MPHPWLQGWYARGNRLEKAARLRAEADRNRREIEALRYALTYARKRHVMDILRQIGALARDTVWREERARKLEMQARSPTRSPKKSNDVNDLVAR